MVTMPIILNPMPQLISVASEGDHYDQMTLEKVLFFFSWFANDSTHESWELENSKFPWSWLWNTVTEGNPAGKQNLKDWAWHFPFIWKSVWKKVRLMLIFKSFIEVWLMYNKLYVSKLCNLINSYKIFVSLCPQSRMWTYLSPSNISMCPSPSLSKLLS